MPDAENPKPSFLIRHWKAVVAIATLFVGIIAALYTYKYYAENKEPDKIFSECIKYESGKLVILVGRLTNNDTTNAEGLKVSGKIKGSISNFAPKTDFDKVVSYSPRVAPENVVIIKDYESGNFEIVLDKLTINKSCNFELIALNDFNVAEPLDLGWGKSHLKYIEIKTPEPKEKKLLEIVDRANELSRAHELKLSNAARKTWIKRNPL